MAPKPGCALESPVELLQAAMSSLSKETSSSVGRDTEKSPRYAAKQQKPGAEQFV